MKTGIFVRGTTNIKGLMAGVDTLNARGAIETNWLLIESPVGLGKTKALQWYSVQNNAVIVRAKAIWTPNSMLKDICEAMDIAPKYRASAMYDQIVTEAVSRSQVKPFELIVDEIDHALRDDKVIETLRDLTDIAQISLIIGGMRGVRQKLKRHQAVYRRIVDVVEFVPASIADTRLLCTELSDVEIDDDLVLRIHRETCGKYDDTLNAIARIEIASRRNRGATITPKMVEHVPLAKDGKNRRAA